eukprot:gene7937-7966_t
MRLDIESDDGSDDGSGSEVEGTMPTETDSTVRASSAAAAAGNAAVVTERQQPISAREAGEGDEWEEGARPPPARTAAHAHVPAPAPPVDKGKGKARAASRDNTPFRGGSENGEEIGNGNGKGKGKAKAKAAPV